MLNIIVDKIQLAKYRQTAAKLQNDAEDIDHPPSSYSNFLIDKIVNKFIKYSMTEEWIANTAPGVCKR